MDLFPMYFIMCPLHFDHQSNGLIDHIEFWFYLGRGFMSCWTSIFPVMNVISSVLAVILGKNDDTTRHGQQWVTQMKTMVLRMSRLL